MPSSITQADLLARQPGGKKAQTLLCAVKAHFPAHWLMLDVIQNLADVDGVTAAFFQVTCKKQLNCNTD